MSKKTKIILSVVFLTVLFLAYGFHWAFYCMERLADGDLIEELVSPDGEYTVRGYLVHGDSIRAELVFNDTKRRPKNIFWYYEEDQATIEWVDDETVIINGIQLSLPHERYDWRRHRYVN